jgi:hypothetical protein
MTYACPTWEYAEEAQLLKLQRYLKPWQAHTGPRTARGFQNALRVRLYKYIMQDTIEIILSHVRIYKCKRYLTRRSHTQEV